VGFGQRGNGLAQRNVRVGPMHEQKVDEIDVEIFQALLDRAREIVRAQVFVRDFGGQKNVAAWHAGGAHASADAALGAVFPGRVDVAIPDLQCGGNDFGAIAQGGGAEADGGDLGAVRGEGGDGGWSHGREREVGAHSTIRLSMVNRPRPPATSTTKTPPWQAGFVWSRRVDGLRKIHQAGMRASSSEGSRKT